MTRSADPVHFFDSRGHSMLSKEHLESQVRELTAEVERLKRLLAAQAKKNQAMLEDQIAPTSH